jgi:hypothetical protein
MEKRKKMNKELYITDEEIIQRKNEIDLFEDGDFTIEKAFLDPETLDFELQGTWTKYPENGERKEVKGVIAGRLSADSYKNEYREPTGTLADVIEPEWAYYEVYEA